MNNCNQNPCWMKNIPQHLLTVSINFYILEGKFGDLELNSPVLRTFEQFFYTCKVM